MTNNSATRPLPQKVIGILGGMGNQATGEYYRMLNERMNGALGGWDNGEIVIVSVNFGNIEYFVRRNLWDDARLSRRKGRSTRACRRRRDRLRVEHHAPGRRADHGGPSDALHSYCRSTAQAIRKVGLRRVGLLGTMTVMQSEELRVRFQERFGIEILAPSDADKAAVDRIIFDELVRRDLRAESKMEYRRVAAALRTQGAQGVILGCTEIFLLIGQSDLPDFPVFDTTALHVEALASFALS